MNERLAVSAFAAIGNHLEAPLWISYTHTKWLLHKKPALQSFFVNRRALAFMRCVMLLMAPFAFVGCGGNAGGPTLVVVSGTLTKGGQPLPNIKVSFAALSDKQRGASAVTDSQGRYTLTFLDGRKGAMPGAYKVVLAKPSFDSTEQATAYYAKGSRTGPPKMPELPFPEEYLKPESSPKQVEVLDGKSNVVDISI